MHDRQSEEITGGFPGAAKNQDISPKDCVETKTG